LRNIIKDEKPLARNTPTIPEFVVRENGDVASQKSKWIALLGEHEHFPDFDFVHPFFGKMTNEQIGYMAYKHTDHHLRQFNS
jgi:hypothetical protein